MPLQKEEWLQGIVIVRKLTQKESLVGIVAEQGFIRKIIREETITGQDFTQKSYQGVLSTD
jgi:hypothetical protein